MTVSAVKSADKQKKTVSTTVNVEGTKVSRAKYKQLSDCRRIITSLEKKLTLANELVVQLNGSLEEQERQEKFKEKYAAHPSLKQMIGYEND